MSISDRIRNSFRNLPNGSDPKVVHTLLLVAGVILLYGSSLAHGFVWDDLDVIVNNPLLKGMGNLPKLLLSEDSTGLSTGYYRPLTYLSFFVDHLVWGMNPFGFHLTNLLLHVGVTVLFYRLVVALFSDVTLAFMAALLFAFHPVNVEAVNFLSGGRNTQLSAFFMLGAFLLHSRRRYLPGALCLLFSILSKEFGLFLPVLLWYYDKAFCGEGRSVRRYLPYLAVIAAYLVLRSFVVGGSAVSPEWLLLPGRLMFTVQLIMRYLASLTFPWTVRIPYDLFPPTSFNLSVALCAMGLATTTAAIFLLRNRRPMVFGSLWFFIFLFPVMNILPLVKGSIFMADRYAYIPSMAFALMAAYAVRHLKGKGMAVTVAVLCVCYLGISLTRIPVWKDEFSLYSRMVVDAPQMSNGYLDLGQFLYDQGRVAEARRVFEQSVKVKRVIPEAFTHLADFYLETGEPAKAVNTLKEGVVVFSDSFILHLMLSRAYLVAGNRPQAQATLARTKALFPGANVDILRQRAMMICREAERLSEENRFAEAERIFKKALVYDPECVRALIGLGSVLGEKGEMDRAYALFKEAAALAPANPLPHYNLAIIYGIKGMAKEAEAEHALCARLGGAGSERMQSPVGDAPRP